LKFPPIKNNAGVNREIEFQKLLSGGYGVDWVKNRRDSQRNRNVKKSDKIGQHKKREYNMTEYQQSISKKEFPKQKLRPIYFEPRKIEAAPKEPFKLSKFSKVSSKLATRGLKS
uniref:Uncharacterized protein n=1 Tax=Ciona savignyi TaxID=51511 RepID=H2YFN9_CIOSA